MVCFLIAGAFLVPYFICLVVAGIPLLIAELSMGQFMAQGGITCWKLVPIFKGKIIIINLFLSLCGFYYQIQSCIIYRIYLYRIKYLVANLQ